MLRSVANGQYFGRITLDPEADGNNAVTIPVAFVKQQGAGDADPHLHADDVPAEDRCAHCAATVANFGSVTANVEPDA